MTQEELLELQKETFETVKEYLANLIPGMNNVASELEGEIKEDTWEYLRMIIDGFNWVIEAFNGIVDYLDEERVVFNMQEIDESVKQLGDAYSAKDEIGVATSLRNDIIPFLDKINSIQK